jgi:hypothetical protein
MMRHGYSRRILVVARPRRGRWPRALRYALVLGIVAFSFMLWPYVALWRIDRAAVQEGAAGLAPFVDLAAVREEILRKLNKDAVSPIGPLSDPFIQWIGNGIMSNGREAITKLVTLEWVRARLLTGASGDAGFLDRISYAFFDSPRGFQVRIGPADADPTHVHLRLQGLQWQINALYY